MSDRIATTCDQCGQTDADPKVHLGAVTKHHDCLSHTEDTLLRESVQPKSQVAASAIIDRCKGGARGRELLAFIEAEQAKTDKREES